MVKIQDEKQAQETWQLLPQHRDFGWFNQMIEHEFLPQQVIQQKQQESLRLIIEHAETHSPYYRTLFKNKGIGFCDLRDLSDLEIFPIQSRQDVRDNFSTFQAEALPPGHSANLQTKTSGSTGEPVIVSHSNYSAMFFNILNQRSLRWFRLDPNLTIAVIREPSELPRNTDDKTLEINETVKNPKWRGVGHYFRTGSSLAFSKVNTVDRQLEWLHEQKPDYLVSMSSNLEHLALTSTQTGTPESIKGTIAIAQQLTSSMRCRVEKAFAAPVFQDYGLNEIGLVAVRCPEGGRYHVHMEHCYVEIVDQNGHACKPGNEGRLLVTGLNNTAMPLIRYDSGDLAIAADGPCPCGRSLPTFQDISGRYVRGAYLPEEEKKRISSLQYILESLPDELVSNIRQYQIHHFKNGSFRLRVATSCKLEPAFRQHIEERWHEALSGPTPQLVIEGLSSIPSNSNTKFESVTSDFYPKN